MRDTITGILLGIAKDEEKDQKDRLKACEALIKLAQSRGEEGATREELKVVVEYGRKKGKGDGIG